MTRRIAILVTGSRDWTDREAIHDALGQIDSRSRLPLVMIHGDAPGADTIAREYAEHDGTWHVIAMPALWTLHGKSAGPRRNAEMVEALKLLRDCGYECHVLAFPMPDSRGTWDCVRKARAAGFEPVIVELASPEAQQKRGGR